MDPVAAGDFTTAQSIGLGGGSVATIGVDGTNSAAGTNVVSVMISHTTGTGPNRLMLVSVGTDQTITVSSVTYNGVALNSVTNAADAGSAKPRVEIFRLVNPASGTHNLVVTLSAAANICVGVNTFTNVDQTTPLGTPAASANTSSVTVNSTANQLVYGTICGGQSETDAAGQTQLWNRRKEPFLAWQAQSPVPPALRCHGHPEAERPSQPLPRCPSCREVPVARTPRPFRRYQPSARTLSCPRTESSRSPITSQ